MKIIVLAKPNKKKTKITKIDESVFEVWITEPATENKANNAIIKALSKHFKVPKTSVEIIKGERGKQKVIEINSFNSQD